MLKIRPGAGSGEHVFLHSRRCLKIASDSHRRSRVTLPPFPRRILAREPLGPRGSILDPPNGINIIYLEAGTEIDPLYLMYQTGHGPPIIDPRLLIHRDTPKGNKSVVMKEVCT